MELKQLDIFGEPPEKSFYNTTHLKGEGLRAAEGDAKFQEGIILELFKKHSPLSPSDVWRMYERNHGSILLTSVRRAITNLTTRGKLTKTSIQKTGVYKRPEYVWKIT